MCRLIAITAFALALAVPLWAQHGGGHGGGGGHAGGFGGGHSFSGGHSGGFSSHSGGGFGGRSGAFSSRSGAFSRGTNHSFISPRSGIASRGFNRRSSRASVRGPYLHNGVGRNGFNRFRNFGYRNCFGYPCRGGYGWGWGYPWWGYYGLWDWWDHSDYDDSYANDRAMANEMDQQSLDEQRMRRQEEAEGDQDAYAQPRPNQNASNDNPGTPMYPPTVLVFRDQHKQEIQNYAVVGQTLWNFSSQKTERISLADLDLTATAQANEDRGLNFRIPVQAR